MTKTPPGRRYDLEDRTYEFARRVRALVKALPRTIGNAEDAQRAIRASASIGANYIEANEALGKKDSLMRLRISRKEAKERRSFLRLLDPGNKPGVKTERDALVKEAGELAQDPLGHHRQVLVTVSFADCYLELGACL